MPVIIFGFGEEGGRITDEVFEQNLPDVDCYRIGDSENGKAPIVDLLKEHSYPYLVYPHWENLAAEHEFILKEFIHQHMNGVFVNESKLSCVSEANPLNSLIDETGVHYTSNGKWLKSCKNKRINEYEIKRDTVYINTSAFNNCIELVSIKIPDSVNAILPNIFTGCSKLKEIHVYNPKPPVIYGSLGNLDKKNCCIYVPAGSLDYYKGANGWNEFKNCYEER